MPDRSARLLAARYREAIDRLLSQVDDLSDAQLAWRPAPGDGSIALHLWHLARCADRLCGRLPRMRPVLGARLGETREIWDADDLATRWGLPVQEAGHDRTGMGLHDATAAPSEWPGQEALLGYARRAFAAAERALAAVDDPLLGERDLTAASPLATVGDALLAHLMHSSRHLGEIEGLRRLQGL